MLPHVIFPSVNLKKEVCISSDVTNLIVNAGPRIYSNAENESNRKQKLPHCGNASIILYINQRKIQNGHPYHKYITAYFPGLLQVIQYKMGGGGKLQVVLWEQTFPLIVK
jgi:hypothetical protein